MSRGVRGPRSALTSFLEEKGITARHRRRQREALEAQIEQQAGTSASASSSSANVPVEIAEEEVEEETPEAETITMEVEEATSRRRSSGKKKAPEDDDDDDFLADIKSPSRNRAYSSGNGIEFCGQCRCRFMTNSSTKVTRAGKLCPACAEGKKTPKNAKPRKRKRANKLGKGTVFWDEDGVVPTLQDICIKIIGRYIDDVETLGDIGDYNMDKIAQIISKHRQLNNHTLKLFLDPIHQELSLYDCTKLDQTGLSGIAHFCPNLVSLSLNYCGRMNDDILKLYTTRFTQLKSLSLGGAFLITDQGFIAMLEALGPQLEKFCVEHTAKLSIQTVEVLSEKCPELREVRLVRCGKMDDLSLKPLEKLTKLEILDISYPGTSPTDDTLISILNHVGSNLTYLGVSDCQLLTDRFLLDGVRPCCPRLRELHIAGCSGISNSGVKELFTDWTLNEGFTGINLARCTTLDDEVLDAVIGHSKSALQYLNLNGLDELSEEGLTRFASAKCENLQELDLSWCRAVNDDIIGAFGQNCPALQSLKVWGCHRVTECALLPKQVKIIGRECDTL
ncbi:RNI-like protein [Basidiobolus meristosporus CBS 931.73]|uniref:RNI-like protein n=1 Tax=Basidiobolus meristosporus CBS 931.73 TaxID=1314790 RepID=A0A1Y1XSS3_9FUNG|nr:RNI-like protein [Basidiobolus meristosporus CBS 931.73]|eukprot:ORX88809.1 RNI-like protein [Basidiobolus meristosporus CBS 931.73]